ncbi:MAG: amidohydrolase family protein [Pseudomonadales bacterium]|nr:amidohydrolase family protein [Pseudomonadales bacterium]
MNVEPLSPTIGAEAGGCNLRALVHHQFAGLRRASARHQVLPLLLSLLLHGCGNGSGSAGGSSTIPVDLILHNAQVLTMAAVPEDPAPGSTDATVTAVAVTDGRIVAVGDESLPDRYQAVRSEDLQGRTLMPGFIDSHIHISGNPVHYIDLTEVESVAEIRELVARKASVVGSANWITGYGWSEDELEEQRRPERSDLDAAAPGHPVFLVRAGAHSAVSSSAALDLAGIDAGTPDPEGGTIERDPEGNLNGIIRERHEELVGHLVPPSSDEALRPSLIANLQALFASGITSIIQASDSIGHYREWQTVYAQHPGNLPRAAVQVTYEGQTAMAAFGMVSGAGDEFLRVGAIKIFADGGFTGPAAYTSKPYKGEDEYRGKLNMSESDLRALIMQAHEDGWQLGIHAIGDAAIALTVDYLIEALLTSPRADHRHYLNHFTVMPDAGTMADMARYGIAITQQPNFTYTLEGRYVANLDGERLETNNPLRTPMNHGIHTALSSDILPIGPLTGIHAAVTRKGMSGRVFGAGERLTVAEALRGYTTLGAWLTREESSKGVLAPGMLADMIVLSENPLLVDPDDILRIEVLKTYLGGRTVFEKSL